MAGLARFRSLVAACDRAVSVAVLGGSVSCGNFVTDRQDGPCPSKAPLNKNSKWLQVGRQRGATLPCRVLGWNHNIHVCVCVKHALLT